MGKSVQPRNRTNLHREEMLHLEQMGATTAPELYAGRGTEYVHSPLSRAPFGVGNLLLPDRAEANPVRLRQGAPTASAEEEAMAKALAMATAQFRQREEARAEGSEAAGAAAAAVEEDGLPPPSPSPAAGEVDSAGETQATTDLAAATPSAAAPEAEEEDSAGASGEEMPPGMFGWQGTSMDPARTNSSNNRDNQNQDGAVAGEAATELVFEDAIAVEQDAAPAAEVTPAVTGDAAAATE